MAISETRLSSGMMSFTNLALSATLVSYTSQASSLYAASNLVQQHRSKRWRSSDVTVAQQIVLDLGSAQTFNCVALIDPNCDDNQTVTLEHSTTSAIASPDSINLSTYAPSAINRLNVWYLSGVGTKQFVRLTLPANWSSVDAFHQLGLIWIGTYTDLRISPNVKPELNDPSTRTQAYGGAEYVDSLQCFNTLSFDVEVLDFSSATTLKALAGALGSKHALLDILASQTDETMRAEYAFYGKLDARRGFTATLRSPTDNMVSFSFTEARG